MNRLTRAARRFRAVAVLPAAGALLLGATTLPALAERGVFSDPDDVSGPLDLKTAVHSNDERSVTYTVETWESFPVEQAHFRWALDRNSDGAADLFVVARWTGSLTAGVFDPAGQPLGPATASRIAPSAVRVSFRSSLVGADGGYAYSVSAFPDGLPGPGAVDVAPDAGSYQHGFTGRKGLAAPLSKIPVGPPSEPPVASDTPVQMAGPAGPPAAVSPPAPITDSSPAPTPQPAAPSAPPVVPSGSIGAARPRPATWPALAAEADHLTALARTGPGAEASVAAGLLLAAGGFCVAVGRPRRTVT